MTLCMGQKLANCIVQKINVTVCKLNKKKEKKERNHPGSQRLKKECRL